MFCGGLIIWLRSMIGVLGLPFPFFDSMNREEVGSGE